jgi:hypothetical protein
MNTEQLKQKLNEILNLLNEQPDYESDVLKAQEPKENRVFIPKEIGLYDENDEDGSMYIINSLKQALFKVTKYKSFSVGNDSDSANTGSNYYIDINNPVTPEKEKVYFVTSQLDNLQENLKELLRYEVVYNDECCYWSGNDIRVPKLKEYPERFKFYEVKKVQE